MWIARDLNGDLYLYEEEPIQVGEFYFNTRCTNHMELDEKLFPELSYENGPKQVKLVLIE